MKHIDETMLLLAVGNVGEDLVARAEKRSVPSRRRVSLHFFGAAQPQFVHQSRAA